MPTSTSLVTNLPADFNTFGQGVDTSMAQLKGGTSGQVLSKTSGTDMAFTWVTPTDQTPLTTKGDLFTFTTVDARLAVGTNYYVLASQSGAATGLQWTGATTAYTPTWTVDVGTPAIGNGQIAGYWQRYGNLCLVRFFFQAGSTTTFGTSGSFYFSLPFTASTGTNAGVPGNFYGEDFAVAGYRGQAGISSSGTTFSVVGGTNTAPGNFGKTSPFTWSTNDYIAGSLVYEVA
jgi:hypothetical protein